MRPPSRSKYGNRKTVLDGIAFASKAEAIRYAELKLLARAGQVEDLKCQPKFPLIVNGLLVATYIADFSYIDATSGAAVVEDVKSPATKTDTYRLKAKLMRALYQIDVKEVFRS